MKTFKETLYITKDNIEFVNKLMSITDETDSRWEEFEEYRDREVMSFSKTFDNGYFASISIASGSSNFFIDPCLFNEDGFEQCVLDCADELLGEYEFEDRNGNKYILDVKKGGD